MSYIKLRFAIRRDRADALNTLLEESGALSVSWENAGGDDYLEAAYSGEPDWRDVLLTGLFHSQCDPQEIVRLIARDLQETLVPEIEVLENQDWERAWLRRFKPRRYQGDLWVCPSWIEPPDPAATNIILDPGLAFGTGDHATTALCLDWISMQALTGESVMDFGCGSGILAIACLLKGASRALGVDVDPRALSASTTNVALNGVSARYEAIPPGGLPGSLRVDLVIANILADVLIDQAAVLTRSTRPGGRILLTGILEGQADRVRQAYQPAFQFDTRNKDQWCLLVGHKLQSMA